MTEQLLDLDTLNVANTRPTIWDIENAEKQQFISFIEAKMEEKYLNQLKHYEQLLTFMQEEHTSQMSVLLYELNETKHKLDETKHKLDEVVNNNKTIYIPIDKTVGQYFPNYHSGNLVFDKYDTKVHCNKIVPQLMEMPNLEELKLNSYEVEYYDKLEITLKNVKQLEIKWNTCFHLKQDMMNYPHAQHSVNKETYNQYIKTNNFKPFPNLEHLIIANLSNQYNYDVNNKRVSQNIIEIIEYYPCKINKITISLNKHPSHQFTGNLEHLQTFCSQNNIEYIVL